MTRPSFPDTKIIYGKIWHKVSGVVTDYSDANTTRAIHARKGRSARIVTKDGYHVVYARYNGKSD